MLRYRLLCDLNVSATSLVVAAYRSNLALSHLKKATACRLGYIAEALANGILIERSRIRL